MNRIIQTKSFNILPQNLDSNFKVGHPSVILANYNEVENINKILDVIEVLPMSLSSLVNYDSSTDETGDNAIRHPLFEKNKKSGLETAHKETTK